MKKKTKPKQKEHQFEHGMCIICCEVRPNIDPEVYKRAKPYNPNCIGNLPKRLEILTR